MTPSFEWDPVKREANLAKHGMDFADAIRVFEGEFLEWESRGSEYGERRSLAVGVLDGRVVTVIYAWRGLTRRLISARRSRKHEERAYRQAF